ncbi:pyridoxal phosphate-dependent decarboxylase family protein [Microbacterium elymi]|uniref:Pyridoxal-dependent decarboxylase n=1 Tax=Microbacterium elymi TaxID=2909587 RepID=A0ABY5NND0_9MICO|nr:pyridoxal-dependent decarboxylase [Microbacterium elymi]UUT36655.1 pyridoxal-dependent decarboxylase [Microbacterium elymi]
MPRPLFRCRRAGRTRASEAARRSPRSPHPRSRKPTRFDHPGFFAHMDPPTPWMSWAAAQWAAAMNQNLLHPDSAPAARRLERLAVDWLAPAFGMDGGHLVPGSTVANLTALWAARDLTGARRVIASSASHLSVAKAAHILGLEYVAVPVDAGERMRVGLLPGDLGDAIVVLTAGTTIAGAVDPLDAASGAAWRHVDAAWAGPLRLSSHADVLDGIDRADSVAVSAHKWLYQPKESALVLFADAARAHDAISSGARTSPPPTSACWARTVPPRSRCWRRCSLGGATVCAPASTPTWRSRSGSPNEWCPSRRSSCSPRPRPGWWCGGRGASMSRPCAIG